MTGASGAMAGRTEQSALVAVRVQARLCTSNDGSSARKNPGGHRQSSCRPRQGRWRVGFAAAKRRDLVRRIIWSARGAARSCLALCTPPLYTRRGDRCWRCWCWCRCCCFVSRAHPAVSRTPSDKGEVFAASGARTGGRAALGTYHPDPDLISLLRASWRRPRRLFLSSQSTPRRPARSLAQLSAAPQPFKHPSIRMFSAQRTPTQADPVHPPHTYLGHRLY